MRLKCFSRDTESFPVEYRDWKNEAGDSYINDSCKNGTLFYRQLDFSSEPGVAKEILENELKNCLTVKSGCF